MTLATFRKMKPRIDVHLKNNIPKSIHSHMNLFSQVILNMLTHATLIKGETVMDLDVFLALYNKKPCLGVNLNLTECEFIEETTVADMTALIK